MKQYAVITGATQGIGRAVAERLLSENFSVAVCARNAGELAALEQEWKERFPAVMVICYVADFSRKEEVTAFADMVLKQFPSIDILVNNAGIFIPGQLADEAEGHLEMLMSVNLYGAYHFTRRLLPKMKEQQRGHIFNMCSVASLKAYPNGGAYSITKYALMGFSENLREELKEEGIRVTALCPGATNSRSWAGSGVPESRIMEAADVANILWASYTLSAQANVETIVMRPLLGDL